MEYCGDLEVCPILPLVEFAPVSNLLPSLLFPSLNKLLFAPLGAILSFLLLFSSSNSVICKDMWYVKKSAKAAKRAWITLGPLVLNGVGLEVVFINAVFQC